MIDERKSVLETLKDSSKRFDGKAMLLTCACSIFIGLFWIVIFIFNIKPIEELWKSFFGVLAIPALIFISYVRLRQLDATSSMSGQIINSIIVSFSGCAFLYIIFITK